MTSRMKVLRSGLQLLIQDQETVTAAFRTWNKDADDFSPESVPPVIASVHRRLQRNLNRLYLLAESYDVPDQPQGSYPEPPPTTDRDDGQTHSENPRLTTRTRAVAEVLQKGHEALDRLSTRYVSVYCMASAIMEPPVANITRSNLKGVRDLASELVGALALVTIEDMTTAHPALIMNVGAGSRAQDVLRSMWAPKAPERDNADEITNLVGTHSSSPPTSS